MLARRRDSDSVSESDSESALDAARFHKRFARTKK